MYPTTYHPKLAMADMRTVIKLAVNTPPGDLRPEAVTELQGAQSRLAVLTSREILDVVVGYLRSGLYAGRYTPPPHLIDENDSERRGQGGRPVRA